MLGCVDVLCAVAASCDRLDTPRCPYSDSFLNAAVVTLTPRAARASNRTSAWADEGATGSDAVTAQHAAAGGAGDSDGDGSGGDSGDTDALVGSEQGSGSEDGGSTTSSDLEHEDAIAAVDDHSAAMAQDLVEFARLAGLDVLDVGTVLDILKAKPHEEVRKQCPLGAARLRTQLPLTHSRTPPLPRAPLLQAGFTRDQLCAAMQVFAPKYVTRTQRRWWRR